VDPRRAILAYLAKRAAATGGALRARLGITRQALSVHLRKLIEAGKVVRSGTTRNARYSLPAHAPAARVVSRSLRTKGLDEDRVWEELAVRLNLHHALRANVETIVRYGFTEMLNNAIEHAEAERCSVRLNLEAGSVTFEVRDPGIGVFHSIASKLHLADEETALIELLKGKTTTMRAAHTGEGIFFTSRAADRFLLRSHRIQVEWNRAKDDIFVSKPRFVKGTDVFFTIQRNATRRLEQVFGEFAPEEYDFQFQKTKVFVKLLRRAYVSRSEAKRLLANLEKFSEVVLDFRDVESVGQGFADEIFRVFARRCPAIKITVEHANSVIDAMIRHASAG
jgi:DNA-binding transcriptional ArsR family regulator